jgi:hypothetical protein
LKKALLSPVPPAPLFVSVMVVLPVPVAPRLEVPLPKPAGLAVVSALVSMIWSVPSGSGGSRVGMTGPPDK